MGNMEIVSNIKKNKNKFMIMSMFMMIFTLSCAVKNPNPKNTSTTAIEKSDIVNVDIEKVIEEINQEVKKTDKDKTLKKKVKTIYELQQ